MDLQKSGEIRSLMPSLPLKVQDEKLLTKELCDLLDRLVKLYQIKDFDEVNSLLLAEWLIEEYKYYDLDLVLTALRKPPVTRDQAWRLTPDTLTNWIDLTRFKRESDKAKKESEERQNAELVYPPLEQETMKLIDEHLNGLKNSLHEVPKLKKGDVDKIAKEDKERQQGRKSVSIYRQAFNVPIEDAEGNPIGTIENVYAENYEGAMKIVEGMLMRGELRV